MHISITGSERVSNTMYTEGTKSFACYKPIRAKKDRAIMRLQCKCVVMCVPVTTLILYYKPIFVLIFTKN